MRWGRTSKHGLRGHAGSRAKETLAGLHWPQLEGTRAWIEPRARASEDRLARLASVEVVPVVFLVPVVVGGRDGAGVDGG